MAKYYLCYRCQKASNIALPCIIKKENGISEVIGELSNNNIKRFAPNKFHIFEDKANHCWELKRNVLKRVPESEILALEV